MRILILFVLLALSGPAAATPTSTPVDEVPAGFATNWIIGHRLMRDGDFAAALPYLYLAYNAQPDEPLIAWDFQRALAYEGYVSDAIGVLDDLVAGHPDSSAWRLRRASLNLRADQTQEALEDLRELRRRGEVNLDVLGTEAAIHLAEGRVGTALDVYRDGLEILPDHKAEIYTGMARILQESDDLDRVPPLMDEALAAVPGDPGLWLVKIRSLAMLEQHEAALAAAAAADLTVLPLRPAPEEAPFAQDSDFMPPVRPTAPPGAEAAWPAESFRISLADHYARRGRLNLAIGVLEGLRADGELGLNPSVWLARMLFATGRQEEAEAEAVRVTDTWPDEGRGWFLRGRLDESRGNWDQALVRHHRAVKLDPANPELRVALLRTLLVVMDNADQAADPELAASRLSELHRHTIIAAASVPEADAEGKLVLGYAFRALGEVQDAGEQFAVAARDPRLRRTALVQQSICLDEAGRVGAARRVLETLREEYPEDAEVANSYGYFLAEKNTDLVLAEQLVREALAAEPNNGAYLDSLGWVFYRRGEYEDAFDYLVQAVNMLPEDPVVLEHLGHALRAMGRHREAQQSYERALANGGDRERLEAAIAEVAEAGGDGP